jgi:ketosteroid isomerase-like protein
MVREAWEQGSADEAEEARAAVEALVAAINSGRAERIVNAMGGGAVFIDSLGARIEGKQALVAAWRAYLRLFPDYRIEVEAMFPAGREMMLHGRAGGTLHRDGRPVDGGRWEILAAWRAQTDSRRVLVWQVFADNKPVYALLGQ